MQIKKNRFFFFFLLTGLAGLGIFTTEVIGSRPQDSVTVAALSLRLAAAPAVITVCPGATSAPPPIVQLKASATLSGDPIRYRWSASAGRIAGGGAAVTWDLSGVQPGYYKAFVEVDTGSADETCQAFSSTTVSVNMCPPPPPVCPRIVISCPQPVVGKPLHFTAIINDGGSNATGRYDWTLSSGTIIAGQGTSSIKIDSTGLAGQSVTATLSMPGYGMDCSASCVVQFPVPLECRKFDEFPDIARNDEKARLDNYAIELQNDPTSIAYVIVHPGQASHRADVQKRATRIVDYLINSRALDTHRIVTLVGSVGSNILVELWTCPQGAKPTVPIR